MAKVRVYELAKEFGVESKAVMVALQEMGEFVRSASSTLEPAVVRRLKERFSDGAAEGERLRAAVLSAVVDGQLTTAAAQLPQLRRLSQGGWAQLQEEIGALLLDLKAPGGAAVRRIEWLTGLWAATSVSTPNVSFTVAVPADTASAADVLGSARQAEAEPGEGEGQSAGLKRPGSPRPEVLGRELEDGFAELLARLFELSETERVRIRQQSSGTQFGHDLQFDALSRTGTVRCHVECKNLTGKISLYDVAPKLLQQLVYWENKPLDYFIVIAPRAEATNELSRLVEDCNYGRKLPFQVLLWSADTGVEELFRLTPQLYRTLYQRPAPALSAQAAAEVARRWEEQLQPAFRIPESWLRYLTTPRLHEVYGEEDFADVRDDAIPLLALTDSGAQMPATLHENVRDWLTGRPERTLLLLAEFGDGKSFFGYELGLDLSAEFLEDPSDGWAVLRIPLRSLREDSQPASLLRRRLDQIGVSPAEWAAVSQGRPTLIILDGFDEMSAQLDPRTLAGNVETLARCVEYFAPAKVMVSSRTHFFEHLADYEQFLKDLGNPRILRIAPIPRPERLAHLDAFAAKKGLEAKLERLKAAYDPIGLAAKPLFLHMIKATLWSLPEEHFSEVALYRQYVDDSLRRKVPDLQPLRRLDEDRLVANLTLILEELAVQLHLSRLDFVNLREFDTGRREDLAQILWAMSGASSADDRNAGIPDARSRVGVRSLLKPVAGVDPEWWPVDFFHRSMREYFVARALVRAVATGSEKANAMMARVPLQPEIVEFARLLMRQPGDLGLTGTPESFAHRLTSVAKSAILPIYRDQYLGGNALTLLFALTGELPRTDWAGLALDYADLAGANLNGLSFRGSSLRNASLDNATLAGTDLREADLTGVQLEQTAPVRALTFDAGTNTAYAAYGDRSVRRWSFGVGGRMSCVTIAQLDFQPTRLDLSPFGDLIVADARSVVVLSVPGAEESWRVVSRFRAREAAGDFRVSGDYLVLSGGPATRPGRQTYQRYDPVTRTLVSPAVECEKGTRTFMLGDSTVLDLWPTGELQLTRARRRKWTELMARGGSSFDCLRVSEDLALLAAGQEGGTVSLWRLDGLRSPAPELTEIWRHRAHAGSVTDVRLSGMYMLSGGMDRTICLFRLTDNWATDEPLRLHRTLDCAGMKIDGVHGPRERNLLGSLIRSATPRPRPAPLSTGPASQPAAPAASAPQPSRPQPGRIPTPAEVFGGRRPADRRPSA